MGKLRAWFSCHWKNKEYGTRILHWIPITSKRGKFIIIQTNSFVESESKIQTLLLISYFISEKSEALYDVKVKKKLILGWQDKQYRIFYKPVGKKAQRLQRFFLSSKRNDAYSHSSSRSKAIWRLNQRFYEVLFFCDDILQQVSLNFR